MDWNRFEEIWNALRDSPNLVMASTAHAVAFRDVWGEYELAIQYEKYAREKDSYRSYIEEQLAQGMDPLKPQRIDTGFRLMKMTPLRKELGELWYEHIRRCGIECQISWQFIHQR